MAISRCEEWLYRGVKKPFLCTNSISEQFTAEVTLLVMIYSIGMR